MKPSVGRIVHYVARGSADGQFPVACRAAVITEVDAGTPQRSGGGRVGLAVLNPTGIFLHSLAAGGCEYDDGAQTPGAADCPNPEIHGNPLRYCPCGWREAGLVGGTWHWPERVE